MALIRPVLISPPAFDATQPHTISFTVGSGGAQVVKNQLTVRNNTTNAIVYQQTQTTFQYTHTIPANTLVNGTNYNATALNSAYISGVISTSKTKYGYAQIYPDWGAWTAIGSTAVNGFDWTVTQMTGYSPKRAFSIKESENPYCTQMVMRVDEADATIPAGTVISIYGVRA